MAQTLTTERSNVSIEDLRIFLMEVTDEIGSAHPETRDTKISARLLRDIITELLANREAQPIVSIGEDELNAALQLHRLKVEGHSQLSDAFRAGFKYARRTAPPAPAVPDDLIMQVRRLVHALKKSNPDHALVKQVPDYMRRAGYWKMADCLRDGDSCRAAILAAAPEGGNEK